MAKSIEQNRTADIERGRSSALAFLSYLSRTGILRANATPVRAVLRA